MPIKTKDKKSRRSAKALRSEALLSFYKEATSQPGPKRVRLHSAMLKMFEQGFWNPGDRLPTDVELTKELPLSVATVQASLNMLAEQGLITRAKRRGSFVASEEHLPRDYYYFQFLHPETGKRVTSEALEVDIAETDDHGPWATFLGERTKYLHISRIMNIGKSFRLHSDFYFADPKIWVLMDFPSETLKEVAIQQLIHVRLGLPALKRDWTVSSKTADPTTAARIGVDAGTVCQQFDVRVLTIGDVPLVYHRFIVPPNEHSLHIAS